MSPQDYTLLRPALERARPDELFATPGARAPGNSANTGAGTPQTDMVRPLEAERGRPRDFDQIKAPVNPYLETVTTPSRPRSPAPPPPAVQANVASAAKSASPPTGVLTAPEVRAKPQPGRLPEFVRPDDDEKYFKPLKRF